MTKTIGFTASKTWTINSYLSVTCAFWSIDEVNVKVSTKTGFILLVPYANKLRWAQNKADFYAPGAIKFPLNSLNWTFDGSMTSEAAFTVIKGFSAILSEDNAEINAGIDWSNATAETVEVP